MVRRIWGHLHQNWEVKILWKLQKVTRGHNYIWRLTWNFSNEDFIFIRNQVLFNGQSVVSAKILRFTLSSRSVCLKTTLYLPSKSICHFIREMPGNFPENRCFQFEIQQPSTQVGLYSFTHSAQHLVFPTSAGALNDQASVCFPGLPDQTAIYY